MGLEGRWEEFNRRRRERAQQAKERVDTQERGPLTDEPIVLNETIHQSTRLRIMTMLVSMPERDRLAYGFIQHTLGLTGGNLTTHLRKLEDADYLAITKEFLACAPIASDNLPCQTWPSVSSATKRTRHPDS